VLESPAWETDEQSLLARFRAKSDDGDSGL